MVVSVNDDVYADDVDSSFDHDYAVEKHYLSLSIYVDDWCRS